MPEHDLLPDAGVVVAAIQRVGDVAVLRQFVFRDVGVHQVQRDPADFQLPDLDINIARRQLDRDLQVAAGGVLYGHQRQGIEIVGRIALLLPAVGIQHLAEIALLVEQAEADEGIVLVAGRFQVIAGEYSQAARVDRQALGKTVFGREIGDQLAVCRRGRLTHARVVRFAGHPVQREVARVGRGPLQGGLRNPAQHQNRIVPAIPPQRRIQPPEQSPDNRLPAPQDVVSQLGHAGKRLGQGGANQEFSDRLNVKRHTVGSTLPRYHFGIFGPGLHAPVPKCVTIDVQALMRLSCLHSSHRRNRDRGRVRPAGQRVPPPRRPP